MKGAGVKGKFGTSERTGKAALPPLTRRHTPIHAGALRK